MWHSEDTWKKGLEKRILQEPLIETRPSLEALHRMAHRPPPRAVLVGIGLCTKTQLSGVLPVDVLGMLLPAEHIRRTVGARSLVVLIADEHALSNDFDPVLVRRRSSELTEMFARIEQVLRLQSLRVIRASSFHHTARYRALLQEIERSSPGMGHSYIKKQVADTEYLDQAYQGIIKVGWTLGSGSSPESSGARCDESVFDAHVRTCFGNHTGFVYCKAGRSLDDMKQKAVPYVALEPAARICLRPEENVFRKLKRAQGNATPETIHGYRNHLRAMAYSFAKHIEPLSGPLEHRVQTVISRIAAEPRRTSASATSLRMGAHATPRRVSATMAHARGKAATPQATGT